MTGRRMLSPEEAWIAAVDVAMRDRARHIESLGREEVDAELRGAGLDPDELRAMGGALAEQYGASPAAQAVAASDLEEEPSPESKRGRVISMVVPRGGRRAPVWLFAAALAAAALLGGVAYLRRSPTEARVPSPPAPSASPLPPNLPPSLPAAAPSATAPEPDLPFESIGTEDPRKYLKDTSPARLYGAARKACAMEQWVVCRDLISSMLDLDARYWHSTPLMALRKDALLHIRPLPAEVATDFHYDEHGKPVPNVK